MCMSLFHKTIDRTWFKIPKNLQVWYNYTLWINYTTVLQLQQLNTYGGVYFWHSSHCNSSAVQRRIATCAFHTNCCKLYKREKSHFFQWLYTITTGVQCVLAVCSTRTFLPVLLWGAGWYHHLSKKVPGSIPGWGSCPFFPPGGPGSSYGLKRCMSGGPEM